jgi:tetratricopeptide (TPR) repeat protein
LAVDKDNIHALFALGAANIALRMPTKAKAPLKRATEAAPTWENEETLVRSLLLLAELEDAKSSVRLTARACEISKSCARAWELQGIAAEAAGSFRAAAEFYKRASKLGSGARTAELAAAAYAKGGDATGAIRAGIIAVSAEPETVSKATLQLLEKTRASFRN